ncbi:hypothetical protein DNTS_015457, partial [Danionella cerebrum]
SPPVNSPTSLPPPPPPLPPPPPPPLPPSSVAQSTPPPLSNGIHYTFPKPSLGNEVLSHWENCTSGGHTLSQLITSATVSDDTVAHFWTHFSNI